MNCVRMMNGVTARNILPVVSIFLSASSETSIPLVGNVYTSHAKRIYLSVEMYGCFVKGLACGASFRQDGARKAVL